MEMLRSVLLTNTKSPRPGLCYVLTYQRAPSLILVGEGKDRNPDPARKIPGSDKIFRPPGDLVGLWLRSWFEKMLLQRCVLDL
jgi:hypothetical protein